MGSSESAYYDDVKDYEILCKQLQVQRKGEYNYEHFEELKKLPCVIYRYGCYQVDFENYPEYKL